MATLSSLPAAIKRSATSYAGQITSMARSLAPAHIRQGISTHVTEEAEGVIRITTISTAIDAHAQEYGSGLQAQRGVKAKYPIMPKPGNKLLAFHWEIATANPERFSFLPDGRVLLSSVMHPGIKAVNGGKGYIRPTYAEFRKKIKGNSTLNNDIRKAIVSDIRRSFQGNRNG
jgi:hypothetical protein